MKTVLCNGVFDLLHYGHLMHLEAARKMGDRLIVSVTADAYVNKRGRPIYMDYERAALVGALKCVDEVWICKGFLDALQRADPDIIVKGRDYRERGLEPEHAAYCASHGIEVRFTDTPKYSATDTINAIRRCSAV